MVDSAAGAVRWPWIVDAGRRGPKVDSGNATAAFGTWRSCAARHGQLAVVVVESTIYKAGVAATASATTRAPLVS